MYKEKKGMGLDSPLMPNKLPGFIFFLPFFLLLLLLLGSETWKRLVNALEKTWRNVYEFITSKSVSGMCNRCCKQSLCLVASHPPPPPPPPPAILPLLDDRGRYQLSIILQVHVAKKNWLRNFVHKNNWKLCETFFNRKKKVSKQVKQKWNIIY